MKPLILSFFAVILSYSLFIDDKKEEEKPVQPNGKSVYIDMPSHTQKADSIVIYKDKIALNHINRVY